MLNITWNRRRGTSTQTHPFDSRLIRFVVFPFDRVNRGATHYANAEQAARYKSPSPVLKYKSTDPGVCHHQTTRALQAAVAVRPAYHWVTTRQPHHRQRRVRPRQTHHSALTKVQVNYSVWLFIYLVWLTMRWVAVYTRYPDAVFVVAFINDLKDASWRGLIHSRGKVPRKPNFGWHFLLMSKMCIHALYFHYTYLSHWCEWGGWV